MEQEYQVYKGLQKPFTLFGLKGINVMWGAVGAGGGLVAFVIAYMIGGLIVGLLGLAAVAGFSIYKINFHLKYGLHNKDWMKGEWIVKSMIKPTFSGKVGQKKK